MVSEFGATLGCKGCLVIGQPYTEECWAKITTCMENDPAHAILLEDHLIRRTEFANTEPKLLLQVREERNVHTEMRMGRHKNLHTPEELRAARVELMWICDQ